MGLIPVELIDGLWIQQNGFPLNPST